MAAGLLKSAQVSLQPAQPDPEADRVAGVGDFFFGFTFDLIVIGPGGAGFTFRGLNNKGQLKLWVTLADGRQAVVRTAPEGGSPAPASRRKGFAGFVAQSAGVKLPLDFWVTTESSSPSVNTRVAAGAPVELGADTPIELNKSSPTEPVNAALFRRAHGDAVDLVFADFESIGDLC